MRKQLLLVALLSGVLALQNLAQKPTSNWTGYMVPDEEPSPASAARWEPGGAVNPLPLGGCPVNDALGSSSNVFTHILTEANPVAVDNDLNTILYVHRNNAGVFGGHSGHLRYDISTNGGASWTSNQGTLNPLSVNGTNAARYPSVAIYNPAGNTVPNNAYLGYYAPTVAATWNGTVSGVRRLDGTGNTENYNQPTATQTLIPRSVVKGAPGVFWAIDYVYNGTIPTGYRVLKGTWNGSTDIVWTVNTTLTPSFNVAYDGSPKTADFAIAFDPTGNIGWICMLTHLTSGPSDYSFYPVFYNTQDAGTTWTGPTTVDLSQYPCISSNIQTGNYTSAGFDLDLTVDVNGNPHALMPVCNGNNAYAVYFTLWHAMVDVTLENGIWNPVVLRNVYRGRGTWGTSPNQVTQDMEPQIARTADGTKIFYAWSDADSSVLQATADQSPNLFAKAYDVVARKWTDAFNFTGCNATWNGKIYFPKMAETVLSNTGNYKLPIVFAEFGSGNDPINPANFHYLDSIYFAPSEFSINQCQAVVSLSTLDTVTNCGSLQLDAGPGGQQYFWSTGASTQAITVTTSGTYSVSVSSNCCTGADTVVVVILSTPVAGFSASVNGFTSTFTNSTTGGNTTYLWDFGDGNISTLPNPVHTYTSPGSYTVCLTASNACGTDSTCHTVAALCAPATSAWTYANTGLTANFTDQTSPTPTAWLWAFGDGNTSTQQNPTHTYATAGSYNACLAITDSCGTDTTCQLVTVCALPVAAIGVDTLQLWWQTPIPFSDSGSGGTSWWWDFGDGGTSTLQNPTHTYTQGGLFTVCLITTNACGSDTACITINVLWEAVNPSLPGKWSIAPVPAHDLLKLWAQDAPMGALRLRLVNSLGQLVHEVSWTSAGGHLVRDISLEGLESGLYYLEVRGVEGTFTAKVVKE